MIKSCALSLLLLVTVETSRAQDTPLLAEFRSAAKAIPQRLLNQGRQRIGNLRMRRLLEFIDRIPLSEVDRIAVGEPSANSVGLRRSGHWWCPGQNAAVENCFIRVASEFWQQQAANPRVEYEVLEMLALHEVLGVARAVGFTTYNDKNYSLSVLMWLVDQTFQLGTMSSGERNRLIRKVTRFLSRSNEELDQLASTVSIATISDDFQQLAASNGGIIGVGGGGDIVATSTKSFLLNLALERLSAIEDQRERNRLIHGDHSRIITILFSIDELN